MEPRARAEQPFGALLNRLLDEHMINYQKAIQETIQLAAKEAGIAGAQADLGRRVWVLAQTVKILDSSGPAS